MEIRDAEAMAIIDEQTRAVVRSYLNLLRVEIRNIYAGYGYIVDVDADIDIEVTRADQGPVGPSESNFIEDIMWRMSPN